MQARFREPIKIRLAVGIPDMPFEEKLYSVVDTGLELVLGHIHADYVFSLFPCPSLHGLELFRSHSVAFGEVTYIPLKGHHPREGNPKKLACCDFRIYFYSGICWYP